MRLPRWLQWRSERELNEEIRAHIEMEVAENIARGLSPEQARMAAARAFGNATQVHETTREANPISWFESFAGDLRYALRQVRRSRALSLTVVLTLTLGIGLNSSVVTVLNALLLRPMVTRDPASFAKLSASFSGEYTRLIHGSPRMFTLEEYTALRGSRSFDALVAASEFGATLDSNGLVDLPSMLVSCNYFDAHVNAPVLGRAFAPDECARPGGEPVAILSESAWKRHFNADPATIGKTVRVNKHNLTVVGVMPDQLTGDVPLTALWVPLTMQAQLRGPDDFLRRPGEHAWLTVTGRLKHGFTRTTAQAELATVAAQLDTTNPGRTMRIDVTDGSRISDPGFRKFGPIVVGLVFGSATLIVLIVCANVTTLLLSRATARRQEMAVRTSLGAGRGRLLRQLLTESCLLALISGAASWWLAHHVPGFLMSLIVNAPDVPVHPDLRILGYILGLSLFAGCVAGLSPAFESLRVNIASSLKPLGRGRFGPSSSRMRAVLVGGQFAMSLALLICAGLMLRTHFRLLSTKLDYDPQSVVTARVDLSRLGHNEATTPQLYAQLIERLGGLPGVEAVGQTRVPPFSGMSGTRIRLSADGAGESGGNKVFPVAFRQVSAGYFRTMNLRVIRGRALEESDARQTGGPVAVVVSDSFARRFWPGADAMGKSFAFDGASEALIVGIAADVSSMRAFEMDDPLFYQAEQFAVGRSALVIRARGDMGALMNAVKSAAFSIDSDLLIAPQTVAAALDWSKRRAIAAVGFASLPACLALLLTMLGVYGIAAFTATQRYHEIGVRLAIGATPRDIVRLLLRGVARPVSIGLAAGLLLGAVLGLLLKNARLILDVHPLDPITYAGAALVLFAAALFSTFLPARRASLTDPWRALRDE